MTMHDKFKWLSIGAMTLSLTGQAAVPDRKPNVLLILVDDMGYGDTGFNGCKDIPTPYIDSIASNGVRFTQGYVTAPQCAPSRAGLLSGMSQSRFNRQENKIIDQLGIPDTVKQFGDYMRDAGYRTGMVGKWHQGTMEGHHPLDRGFDWFYGFLPGSTHFMPPGNLGFIPHILENREPQKVSDYLTFVFGDKAIDFITRKSDKPFFLYLAFNAPHAPLQAPQEYLDRFEHLTRVPDTINYVENQKLEHPRQVYAAMVSALDDTIGKILQVLRDNGLEEDTLIYFLSDNGGPTVVISANNGPLRGEKGDLLEGGARVPFAAQWKGTIPGGQTIETPVSSLDLLPTSLAAAGTAVPGNLDGVNLLPLVKDGRELSPRTLFWCFPYPPATPVWAIRSGDWKLVHEAIRVPKERGFSWGGERTGLYRINEDIHEDNDLSAQYPEVLQRLQNEYGAWASKLPSEPARKPETRRPPAASRAPQPTVHLPSGTLFMQDFADSDKVADYVNANAPSQNQFTAFSAGPHGTFSIENGQLSVSKTANGNVTLARAVPMEGCPVGALSFSYDVDFSFTSAKGTRLITGTIGSPGANWMAYGIDSVGIANTWKIFGSSESFTGPQTLTFYMNDSGLPVTYTAPDGSEVALAFGTHDLWVGKTKVNSAKTTGVKTDADLSTFSIHIQNSDGGKGTFTFDHFAVRAIP